MAALGFATTLYTWVVTPLLFRLDGDDALTAAVALSDYALLLVNPILWLWVRSRPQSRSDGRVRRTVLVGGALSILAFGFALLFVVLALVIVLALQ